MRCHYTLTRMIRLPTIACRQVRDALAKRPDGDVAGVVAFGRDALVERLPDELTDLDRIASTPVQAATDIGAALRLAGALFPDAAQQRIVLLSDGNDTTGTGQVEAARAGARGIQVTTRTIGLGASDEVMVDRISVPTTSRLGEELEVSVEIRSTVAQPAAVRLYADGALVATERTALDAGITRVVFQVDPEGGRLPRLPGRSSRRPGTPSPRTTGQMPRRWSRGRRASSWSPATKRWQPTL